MYDTWMYDREESHLIISVCYWTRDSSHDEMIRSWLVVDFILYIVELWCHSRSLSITYAKEYSYGSSLYLLVIIVVILFHIPHLISCWCSSMNKYGLVVDVTIHDDDVDAIDTIDATASIEIHFKCIQSDKIKK